jgi:hypothetical protein
MNHQDAIEAELQEIEHAIRDDRISEDARLALMGASQALRHILDPETWHPASQTFYRLDARSDEAASPRKH